jgi:hypothetical protein
LATRQNFSAPQRESAFRANAEWLAKHRVTGVELALSFEPLRHQAKVYYCENCLFCHSDQQYFDIDHLVPDRNFRLWQKHVDARHAVNMVVLCKSVEKGDLGCNQSKGAKLFVPVERGLALSRSEIDMNCFPFRHRPKEYEVPR